MPFLNPTAWFRARSAPSCPQTGHSELDLDHLVVESGDMHDTDFMAINVRPLTYAEASTQRLPAANRRIVSAEPYTSIDESKLAVQAVDEYIQQCEQRDNRGASVHVTANIEFESNGASTLDIRGKRNRHKRNRRRASNAKTLLQQEQRENSRTRDKLKSQNTISPQFA